MAIIKRPQGRLRPQYAQKVYTASVSRGTTRIGKWPRKKPARASSWEQSIRDRFKAVAAHIKTLGERETTPLRTGLANFLRENRGQRGSAAIRFRDLLTQLETGRLWAIDLPNGKTVWPAAVAKDVSDTLDWTDPTVGSLLVNHQGEWLGTDPCQVGNVFTSVPNGGMPSCCPAARRYEPPADAE